MFEGPGSLPNTSRLVLIPDAGEARRRVRNCPSKSSVLLHILESLGEERQKMHGYRKAEIMNSTREAVVISTENAHVAFLESAQLRGEGRSEAQISQSLSCSYL